MKKLTFLLVASVILVSCGSATKEEVKTTDSVVVAPVAVTVDSVAVDTVKVK